jgi:voltage-gated potassium channel
VEFDLEEVLIHKSSSLNNLSLKEARIPEKTRLMVMAIKKKNSPNLIFNPSSDEMLTEGDTMIVLGQDSQVNILRELATGND